jgi:UDP-galactopyranose mutase
MPYTQKFWFRKVKQLKEKIVVPMGVCVQLSVVKKSFSDMYEPLLCNLLLNPRH